MFANFGAYPYAVKSLFSQNSKFVSIQLFLLYYAITVSFSPGGKCLPAEVFQRREAGSC
jgi:hypothetical protein